MMLMMLSQAPKKRPPDAELQEKQGTSRNIRNLKNIVGINVPSMVLLCS